MDFVLWGGIECCFGATDLITAPDVIGSPEGVKIGGGCVETAVGMLGHWDSLLLGVDFLIATLS